MGPLLVVAGNYQQYRHYLRKEKIHPAHATYVMEERHLLGVDGEYVLVGTWWENKTVKSGLLDHLTNSGRLEEKTARNRV
jgi:hypothetical protein